MMRKNPCHRRHFMPDTATIREAFAHYQGGRLAQARLACEQILASQPQQFNALNILGAVQLAQEDYRGALASLEKAVALKADNVQALTNLGSCLDALQQYADALRCYRQALQEQEDYAPALSRLGNSLSREGDHSAALDSYRAALAHTPDDPVLRNNCGSALAHLGRFRESLVEFETALELDPGYTPALANQASALSNLKRFAAAAQSYDRLLQREPENARALAKGFLARRHVCDWRDFEQRRDAVLASGDATAPFNLLSLTDSGARQLAAAQAYACGFAGLSPDTARPTPGHGGKIRIAYLSADFREHPVSYLMAGVFEHHNRERFELTAVNLSPPDSGPMGQRLAAAFDHWLDFSGMTEARAATLLRERGIDIAIDLAGYTRGNRAGILARRPAPVQISYLGYPGTLGADFIDYIIADDFLVPASFEPFYSETIIRLPGGFQPFDDRQRALPLSPDRVAAGLPEDARVFCCFNASYKISPPVFETWMSILKQVPNSVLWLLARDAKTRENLLAEAASRGIPAQRLVFAGELDYASHLARLPLADLFLDTFPFNGGTTASDALQMGLPLLTISGESFASRMAGSLLTHLGLPELVTADLAGYQARAIELARGDNGWLRLRDHLQQQRQAARLFDTAAFCRGYETALENLWQHHLAGAPPCSFGIDRA
jgi:predicted O-linked N-acetylglucosamine transferase (SPINDLY family)